MFCHMHTNHACLDSEHVLPLLLHEILHNGDIEVAEILAKT